MTDNKIIKALKCCNQDSSKGCFRCPYRQYSPACLEKRNADIIDLINRQKAELDDLKRDDLPRCKDSLRRANEIGMALEMENQALKVEIERLGKGITFNYELNEEQVNTIQEQCLIMVKRNAAEIKANAIKEFAKRLNKEAEEVVIDREGDFVFANDKFYETVADWCKETSNNLTKEMVGAYSNETQKETETGK